MSNFWHWWIVLITLACLGLTLAILLFARHGQGEHDTTETTGHAFDGIEEYDNPIPHWWFLLFIATFVFALGYLLLYPGLGYWKGVLGWQSVTELAQNELKHKRRFAPEFARYAAIAIPELIKKPAALQMGQRIFLQNCAPCHGSDAQGNFGFPNLANDDWLYGGTPEDIKTTLLYGRQGQMPAWGAILGEKGVRQVSSYARTLSGLEVTASESDLAAGKKIFKENCALCHQESGIGNTALGAPNLTNDVWLYGSSQAQVEYTVRRGRNGVMPAWKELLGEDKVHIVAAYIYSLSNLKASPVEAGSMKERSSETSLVEVGSPEASSVEVGSPEASASEVMPVSTDMTTSQ